MRWTIERRFNAVLTAATVMLLVVGGTGLHAVEQMRLRSRDLFDIEGAAAAQGDADKMHEALRSDALSALVSPETFQAAVLGVHVHALQAGDDMRTVARRLKAADVSSLGPTVERATTALSQYANDAERLVAVATENRTAATRMLPALEDRYRALESQMAALTAGIEKRGRLTESRAAHTARRARLATAIAASFALVVLAVLGHGTRKGVRRVLAEKASAELDRARTMESAQEHADRAGFANRLHDAFEMLDREDEIGSVVARTLERIEPQRPAELLLADSSQAHLHLAVSHPTCGSPGCPVDSPWDCVAVRRGRTMIFDSADALNVCPKLYNRETAPSAPSACPSRSWVVPSACCIPPATRRAPRKRSSGCRHLRRRPAPESARCGLSRKAKFRPPPIL